MSLMVQSFAAKPPYKNRIESGPSGSENDVLSWENKEEMRQRWEDVMISDAHGHIFRCNVYLVYCYPEIAESKFWNIS